MSTYCNCMHPQAGEEWVALGRPGNVMDYQVCERCGLPIQGTQETHQDDDEGDE